MAQSTLRNRTIQWNCYRRFCETYDFDPYPCSVPQAGLYATYLSQYMLHSSITTYILAVVFFHNINGYTPPSLTDHRLRATLKGIQNRQSIPKRQKDPLHPRQLMEIYRVLKRSCDMEMVVWCAMLFLFRTLLRVSHVINSPHMLRGKDLNFTEEGVIVEVRSSKTRKSFQKPQVIPLVEASKKELCPVSHLKKLFRIKEIGQNDPVFYTKDKSGITYAQFHNVFNELISRAGIRGDFATHSLRRGGATFMSTIKCSVQEICTRSNWPSDCVYEYLAPQLEEDLGVDWKFAYAVSKF